MNACYWANEEAAISLLEAGADSNLRNIVTIATNFLRITKVTVTDSEMFPCLLSFRTDEQHCTKCVVVQLKKKKS